MVASRPLVAKNPKKGDPLWLAFGIYGSIGLQLAVAVAGGLLFGDYLDKRWSTGPWLAVTGLILGSIGGFANLIRLLGWQQKRRDTQSLKQNLKK